METSALSFGQPWVLNFLWLLVPVAALFWWAERRRRALIGRIVAPKLRAILAGNTSPFRRIFRGACVVAALALLVVALAEPRLGYDTLEVPHRGRDVVIAMDVSRSMMATDVAPTRLQRAKLLAEDLVSELGGDRIGLVAFAGSAFLQAPLTLDHGAVLSALDEIDTDLIPKGGTNLAAAIRASGEAFTKAEGFSRAIIIISDGEELDADGLAAARDAAADGVRIFTVGVGSAEGSEIPLAPGEFVRDPSGKVVQSKLDAARMKEIAEITGGFYTSLDEQAARLLAAEGIGKMAESEIDTQSSRRPIERYQWPLGAALVLLVLQALVGERRRVPFAATAAALWAATALPAQASGLSAYEQGNYEQARQEFENRLKMEPEAPNLQLNAGAAAYRLKDYGKASQYFSQAMLAEDPALRSAAEFNLGTTLFRQGEGQEDKEKKVSDWKDAIAQYEAALKTRPDYSEARENKERVEQLLEELEKEQTQDKKQDQKKDQQKQDQQQQDQQQKDQPQQGGEQDQKQDQQQGDKDQPQQQGGGKDQEKKDQQGGQEQKEPSGDGGKDQKDQQGQSKDEQKQDGQGGEQKQDQQGGGQDKEQQDGEQGEKEEKQQGGQGEPKPDQQGGGQPEDQEQKGAGEKPDDQKQDGQGGEQKQDQPGGQDKEQQDGEQGEKDEQQQGGQGEQPQDRGESGAEKSEQGSPSGPGDREQKQGAGKPGDAPAPAPTPSGPKKEGELRGTAGGSPDEAGEEGVGYSDAPNEDGSMSEGQARALLRALQGEEEKVDLLERRAFQDVSRDW
ncbi:MAG: VWA domain-containing protein [Chthoniobacterales bacterium]